MSRITLPPIGGVYHIQDIQGEISKDMNVNLWMKEFYTKAAKEYRKRLSIEDFHQRRMAFSVPDVRKYTGQWAIGSNRAFDTGWWLNGAHRVSVTGQANVCFRKNELVLRDLKADWVWHDRIDVRGAQGWWNEEAKDHWEQGNWTELWKSVPNLIVETLIGGTVQGITQWDFSFQIHWQQKAKEKVWVLLK